MPAQPKGESVVEVERQVLQALCHGAPGSGKALDALRSYRWREPLHQVLFEVLVDLPGAQPEVIGELLPARLTRRGFPDVDPTWFQSRAFSGKEAERLINRLLRIEGVTE